MSTIAVIADQLHPLVITFQDPVYQRQSIELDFSFTNEQGVNDITGTLWSFHLRAKGADGPPLISKSTNAFTFMVDDNADLAYLRLSPAETTALVAAITHEF